MKKKILIMQIKKLLTKTNLKCSCLIFNIKLLSITLLKRNYFGIPKNYS